MGAGHNSFFLMTYYKVTRQHHQSPQSTRTTTTITPPPELLRIQLKVQANRQLLLRSLRTFLNIKNKFVFLMNSCSGKKEFLRDFSIFFALTMSLSNKNS